MYSVKAYAFCKDDLELIENFNECIHKGGKIDATL